MSEKSLCLRGYDDHYQVEVPNLNNFFVFEISTFLKEGDQS